MPTVTLSKEQIEEISNRVLELLSQLEYSRSTLEKAADSFSPGNLDDTDKDLLRSVKASVTGLGGDADSEVVRLLLATSGTNLSNALSLTQQVLALVEDEEPGAKEAVKAISESMIEGLHPKFKDTAKRLTDAMGPDTLITMYGLILEGMKIGLWLGWRAHEIALLEHELAEAEKANEE